MFSWFKGKTVRKSVMLLMVLLIGLGGTGVQAAADYHIAVISDIHYKAGETAKHKVLDTINTWDDVNLVAVLGDMVHDTGDIRELQESRDFINRLNKPLAVIVGNHDYMYKDAKKPNGGHVWGTPEQRQAKLDNFKEAFGLKQLHYTKKAAGYLLVFISVDDTEGGYLTGMSPATLQWLKDTLQRNKRLPTIIFFHAPLAGTLANYGDKINAPSRIAQPEHDIQSILRANPQVFMWVSGHTHTPATEPSFKSDINLYDGRVVNVHTSSMTGSSIWSNSLYLYGDKVVVKTFNHKKGQWLENLERTVPVPQQ